MSKPVRRSYVVELVEWDGDYGVSIAVRRQPASYGDPERSVVNLNGPKEGTSDLVGAALSVLQRAILAEAERTEP